MATKTNRHENFLEKLVIPPPLNDIAQLPPILDGVGYDNYEQGQGKGQHAHETPVIDVVGPSVHEYAGEPFQRAFKLSVHVTKAVGNRRLMALHQLLFFLQQLLVCFLQGGAALVGQVNHDGPLL